MENFNLTTPVAFIIFNRPETTSKVFEAIRQAKPKKLFVIADGPRPNKPGEKEKCLETRSIVKQIDWDCEVHKNYSEFNLGCRNRVSSGLDWVFSNVEEAIILEDDCLPHPTFFRYCQELLERYKDNQKIIMISGNNVLHDYKYSSASYYFSEHIHIWGWATWKRVWSDYDVDMNDFLENNSKDFYAAHVNRKISIKYWQTILNDVYNKKIDTWDYQLQYFAWKNNHLAIVPANNLVVNLGFGLEATNTAHSGGHYSKMHLKSVTSPLIHPTNIEPNIVADNLENKLYHKFGFKEKIRRLLIKVGVEV
jgi:hypothetical protein